MILPEMLPAEYTIKTCLKSPPPSASLRWSRFNPIILRNNDAQKKQLTARPIKTVDLSTCVDE